MEAAVKKSKESLKDKAYKIVKDKIINCIYAPGSILNEADLAESLGLSRTPVREAVSMLESEGYVQTMPKKGIAVSEITLREVLQVFQTRRIIEPITLKLSAPHLQKSEIEYFYSRFQTPCDDIQNSYHLDTAMHLFLIEHCGNQYLINMMQKVFEQNTRIILFSRQNQMQIHDAQNEHLKILQLLLNNKTQEASDYMTEHIDNCRDAALTYFCNYGIQDSSESADFRYKSELNLLEKK